MHDPSFLAFDIHAPIPLVDRWASKQYKQGKRFWKPVQRRTNDENLGERVYPWWTLRGYSPRVGSTIFKFPTIVEVWHDEPGGADMGDVCNYRERHGRPIRWAFAHRHHLRVKFMPVVVIRRWRGRCSDCHRRFGRSTARFSNGWDSKETFCYPCSSLRHTRRQVADLAKYVRHECTSTELWRVEHDWLNDDSNCVKAYADLGVGGSR
mgnify:CR=1 FL=1